MRNTRQAARDARRLWRLCQVDGSADELRVRSVVARLIEPGHRSSPNVLRRFLRLVKRDLARRTAYVESATPLSPEARTAIEASLRGRYGENVTTTFVVEPALIGGMRIRIDNDVYDGSVRAGLAALDASF